MRSANPARRGTVGGEGVNTRAIRELCAVEVTHGHASCHAELRNHDGNAKRAPRGTTGVPPRSRHRLMLHSFAGGTQSKEQKLYEASKAAAPLAGSAHTAPHTAAATTTAATARTITLSAVSRHDVPPIPTRRTTCARRRSCSRSRPIRTATASRGPPVCMRPASTRLELTRTPRGLRWVRTGYAYQPPALCAYRTRRAACPQGPTYCAYWVRITASAVLYVPATQAGAGVLRAPGVARCSPNPNADPVTLTLSRAPGTSSHRKRLSHFSSVRARSRWPRTRIQP